MEKRTIYFGRFISTPAPTELLIRSGAVLVTGDNGKGVIEDVDWEVQSAEEAKGKFGGEAEVVAGVEDGFFFPGFIGMVHLLLKTGDMVESHLPRGFARFAARAS